MRDAHDKTFGDLRALLQEDAPRDATWRGLCRALATWTDLERLRHEVAPYLKTHLTRWPQDITRPAPATWLLDTLHGEDAWPLTLTNDWSLHPTLSPTPAAWDELTAHATNLRTLRLERLPSEEIAGLLRAARGLTHLEAIAPSPAHAHALLSALGPALTHLELRGYYIEDEHLETLPPRLTSLRINGHALTDDCPLFAGERTPRLRELELSGGRELTGDALEQLLWLDGYEGLESLGLASSQLGDDGAYLLTERRALRGLRSLDLTACEITARGVEEFATTDVFSALEHLDLSLNARSPGVGITSAIARVARSPDLPKLQSLGLRNTGLLADALPDILARGPRRLELGNNDLGDRAARLIAMTPEAHTLESLGLQDTTLTSEGVTFLAGSRTLQRLHTLTLWGPHLDTEAFQTLMHGPLSGQLRDVNISGLPLSEGCVRAAQRSPHLYGWRRLRLGGFGQRLGHTLGLLAAPGLATLERIDFGVVEDLAPLLTGLAALELPNLRAVRARPRDTGDLTSACLRFLETSLGRQLDTLHLRWPEMQEEIEGLATEHRRRLGTLFTAW